MVAVAGKATGKIVQVIGSTFDVEFPEGHLPEIYNAVKIDEIVHRLHADTSYRERKVWVGALFAHKPAISAGRELPVGDWNALSFVAAAVMA